MNTGCVPSKSMLKNSHIRHQTRHNLTKRGIKSASVISFACPSQMLTLEVSVTWVVDNATLNLDRICSRPRVAGGGLLIGRWDLVEASNRGRWRTPSLRQRTNLPTIWTEKLETLNSSLLTEASFSTRIILEYLRPVLYASNRSHYTAALNKKNESVVHLNVVDALKIWDPTLKCALRIVGHAKLRQPCPPVIAIS